MKRLLITGVLITTFSFVLAQDQGNNFPVFRGYESSFENYFLKRFLAMKDTTEPVCDTSIGLVEFYINEDGRVKSVHVPSNFPEEIERIIETTIKDSNWVPVKGKKMRKKLNVPIILPVYISIESGCKPGDFRHFGLAKDFQMIFPGVNERTALNCFLMEPVYYVVPYGFEDLNPK